MKYLIDADLLLESLINRFQFSKPAEILWEVLMLQETKAYLTTTGLEKILSVCEKLAGIEAAAEVAWNIQNIASTCNVDLEILQDARTSKLKDFESAIEIACVEFYGFDAIVTETPESFGEVDTQILSVDELVEAQGKNSRVAEWMYEPLTDTSNSPLFVFKNDTTTQQYQNSCNDHLTDEKKCSLTLESKGEDFLTKQVEDYPRVKACKDGAPYSSMLEGNPKLLNPNYSIDRRQEDSCLPELLFDGDCPDMSSFELFIQKSLELNQLDGYHSAKSIIEQAHRRCTSIKTGEPVVEIHLAWLKTECLEIIHRLSPVKNRQKFDLAVQDLFDDKNPDSPSFCASITRTLRQFRLSGTYEAKDVIAEAYTRGVKHITGGKLIDVPLAWLRGTCMHVISELKRKQLKSDNPKFDREDCVAEEIAFSKIVLREDLWALQLALQQLSQEEQQLLRARIFKGLSWQEIGESITHPNELPLSPGIARQRGSRVLKKLRQHYNSIRENVQLPDDGIS